jgi:hypothetical protein
VADTDHCGFSPVDLLSLPIAADLHHSNRQAYPVHPTEIVPLNYFFYSHSFNHRGPTSGEVDPSALKNRYFVTKLLRQYTPFMSQTNTAGALNFPTHLSVRVLGKYTVLKVGQPARKNRMDTPLNFRPYRRSFFHLDRLEETFNNYGELLYGGLILLFAPVLFIYFSLTTFILHDGTELFLTTVGFGALAIRLFVLGWIARLSYVYKCSLQDPLLLGIVMPGLACIVTGIVLSDLDENKRAKGLCESKQERTAKDISESHQTEESMPAAVTAVQPLSPAAIAEALAEQKQRIQELEEAELARIAS